MSDKLKDVSFEVIEREQLAQLEEAERAKYNDIKDLEHTILVVRQRQKDNLETKEVCEEICMDIQSEIDGLKIELEKLTKDKTNVIHDYRKNTVWIKTFSEIGEIDKLNRCILANLIDKIYVYEDKRILIKFRYQDRYEKLLQIEKKIREAV